MSGIGAAAAAVLDAAPADLLFPAVAVLTRLNVHRGSTGSGPMAITGVRVVISGQVYDCGASGAFVAEVSVASTSTTDPGTAFVGRQVKVEAIGGALIVAYTVNWS